MPESASVVELPTAGVPVTLPAARRGRPPVFDEARRNHFCSLLQLGCTISKAARLVGMSRRGILYAARRDPQLAERIRLARMESRLDPIRKISSSRSWQAAAWLLERNSRHFRLPPKPSAARQADKLFKSKRLRRRIRRMVEKLLANPHEIARNGKWRNHRSRIDFAR
jgi:hypothetical protein